MFTPRLNNFSGVPQETLQLWLTQSQQALHDLSTGGKGESYRYTQGDGSKSVTYTRANLGDLQAHINALLYALGMRRRRAIRPVF
ncbi:gpW family head-tail joining protein [Pseudomonas bohemica]|uniref:gpW family head-tail joining protein n=1 Tax=Pseudomonas bohemica TaxID=2044872 RepID=UPI000DA5FB84|nr:gpW family head-tail joining protein [Pseudomonas bohemica]